MHTVFEGVLLQLLIDVTMQMQLEVDTAFPVEKDAMYVWCRHYYSWM